MGRIFSGGGRNYESVGDRAAAIGYLLFPQGDSLGKFHPEIALSRLSFTSDRQPWRSLQSDRSGNDTGLVTFADYDSSGRGWAGAGAARLKPPASQADRAGSRADKVDAQKIEAGCDAGKGAFEPAAGSLAGRKYVCEPEDFMSRLLQMEAKETE